MSCVEGQRLSALFLQAALARRDLESRRAGEKEVDSAALYEEDCKRQVTEHAGSCPDCGPDLGPMASSNRSSGTAASFAIPKIACS